MKIRQNLNSVRIVCDQSKGEKDPIKLYEINKVN